VRPNFNDRDFQFSRNMVVVRDGDALTLINSMRLDEAGLAKLDALGEVRNIIKLGSFHGRDDAFYLDRYDAQFWAPAGMKHERGVETDRELVPGQPGPIAGASVFIYETAAVPEAIIRLDAQGGVLVSCDSLQNWSGPDEYFDEASAAMMAANGFFRTANVGPGWRSASKPEASDFERLIEMEFRHLLSAHGDPLIDSAHEDVVATLKELFGV